jgi:hypothetical protein
MQRGLVIPLFVQVIYQPIFVLISPPPPSVFLAKRNAAVAPAGWHEAGARRCEDDEHVLSNVRSHTSGRSFLRSRLTAKKRYIPAHIA